MVLSWPFAIFATGYIIVALVQLLSHVWLFVIPWPAARQGFLSFTISQSLLKPTSIESMMPSNHLILSSSCPQSFPALRTFPSSGQSIGASASVISLSNEYSGFISFQIDWFVLPAVQGTLKSLLQHHNPKASILWCSDFFVVQLSHLYMTTGNHWFDYMDFVGKVISLLFNMLSSYLLLENLPLCVFYDRLYYLDQEKRNYFKDNSSFLHQTSF